MVARQDWHVPRLMSGDLVFRLETGGLTGCLSDGRQGVMPSADEGWENRNARQSRLQPNRMLQGKIFSDFHETTHEINWTEESEGREKPFYEDTQSFNIGAGIVIPCNGPYVDSFAHIVVMGHRRTGVLALRYDSRAAERVSQEFKKKKN
ncbi:hypothetical protein ALC56_04947 [Trachymyrmex septentrionalis]|uniref:Uncharacterized protein n=1 Tax=Trachymyrmex septentrionalis TaxID=34720 RepID=A0A195FJR0_9HYME|nr:hypothetical protein ALC56_04947 [Trachymyrmex septentrionalis]